VSATPYPRSRPAETVAGFLAAASIFVSITGVMYRPLRLIPLAIVLALIATAIGIYFTLHAPHAEFEAPGWLTPAAIAVALSGILLAYLTYQRRAVSADTLAAIFAPIRRAAIAKFWLDDLYLAIYRYGLLTFARVIGWLDRYVVDGVLNVISAWTLDGGDRLRRMQTGKVQDYVWALGLGLLALVAWIGVGW
jgi:NADH:ubiquinone oxidoreductase subunit 5 (subunit L)/multisubunit Na+/H+ antiporter MnhA subunit